MLKNSEFIFSVKEWKMGIKKRKALGKTKRFKEIFKIFFL